MAASDSLPVVVVGAGVCGLSAAACLREAGQAVILLEAADRIGGRARTLRPSLLGSRVFDAGASWLHAVERNPLADLARAAGLALEPAHRERHHLVIDGRDADAAEQLAAERADAEWRRFAAGRAADPERPDSSLFALGSEWRADDPFLPNLELGEGAIIAAADADSLSARDWHRNQLSGDDLLPTDGVGALVATLLGPAAGPVRLRTAVLGIDSHCADRIELHTDSGTIAAAACIVTVSTGVLRAESIRFRPALPGSLLVALDGLPMGLLSKLALCAPGAGWIDPGAGDLWEERLGRRSEPGMLVSAAPASDAGAPALLTGWFGGRFAWELADRPAEALAELRARLARCCGSHAASGLSSDGIATEWGTDPLFRGAYAYARPGRHDARAVLGEPFAGGRIVFAGEACRTDGLAGTVGGAFLDGRRAARSLRPALIVA